MAHLFRKKVGGNYSVKIRFKGRDFKRSLLTSDESLAEERLLGIQRFLKRLAAGRETIPGGIEPGAYIVSEGAVRRPIQLFNDQPNLRHVIDLYLVSQKNRNSDGYVACQRTHLRTLCTFLGEMANRSSEELLAADLEAFLQKRLELRHRNTVVRERVTLMQFGRWAYSSGYIKTNLAATLEPIKGGPDLPPFRTPAEIDRIIERGGLNEADVRRLWRCVYLPTDDIAALLELIRKKYSNSIYLLLHAIPAYTGLRRGELIQLWPVPAPFVWPAKTGRCLSAKRASPSRLPQLTVRQPIGASRSPQ